MVWVDDDVVNCDESLYNLWVYLLRFCRFNEILVALYMYQILILWCYPFSPNLRSTRTYSETL